MGVIIPFPMGGIVNEKDAFVISVKLGKGCYRHLKISVNETLEYLNSMILWAFDFDEDHAHAFFMDNKPFSRADSYYCAEIDMDEEYRHTCDYTLAQTLTPGKPFKYIFDFGDSWEFDCKVLRKEQFTEEEDVTTVYLLRRCGESPDQYGSYTETDEDPD